MTRFNVFFDNNCPPSMARTLQAFLNDERRRVVHLKNVLPANVSDVDWIGFVSRQAGDWIVVTRDRRILTRSAERIALRRARLRLLAMSAGLLKLEHHEQMARLIQQWPRVEAAMALVAPPAGYRLPPKWNASLEQLAV